MADKDVLFFWMTGVITPSLWTVLSKTLTAGEEKSLNLFTIPDFRQLCAEFSVGQIGELEFCAAICKGVNIEMPPAILRLKMLEEFCHPNQVVLEQIQQLKPHYQKWLVVDLPRSWYKQLAQKLQLEAVFLPEKIIYLSESRLPKMIPDVFEYFPQKAGVNKERCLLLDEDARRTIQAINHGLPSAVIMNGQRLEKEFLLRKMTAQEYSIHIRPVLGKTT